MGESINEKLSGLYIAIIFSIRLVVVFLLKKINERLALLSIKLINRIKINQFFLFLKARKIRI
ncbi:hypothetical protein B9T30_05465 [Acinetobacter sp. ANC 4973]|nr:hypothetical protein B9T30_05465 [Acinetobacter sp. ANC 4973]